MPLAVATDLTAWWAPALAFLAGMVSFASPCVFPLVPGYVSFVTGERVEEDDRGPLVPILLFIAGFAMVFSLLGAFSAQLVPKVQGLTGQRVAGAVVVVFGVLMVISALGRGSARLYAERRPFLRSVKPGPAWAAPLGMAFAAGWTPCIGPVLGGILGLASQGGVARGMLLLLSYSAGLGVPFLLVGLGVDRFMGAFGWVKRHHAPIAVVSGALLVAVGVLLLSGQFTRLFAPLARYAPGL
ncbi:MAG: cytochrome C biogenesis protein [Actinobacteria bacterium]|nr:cytochrome C biogenesis protein [Actinomycetota bacterium]